MPSYKLPEVEHFERVTPTKEPIDFVSLQEIDLATYDDGPEARRVLARQFHDAMTTQGFFILTGHGITEEEVERQTDIGHTIMVKTPQEEKERLRSQIREKGDYHGFKPCGVWKVDGDKSDTIEQFNAYRDLSLHEQPQALEPYRTEIQAFVDTMHKVILFKLLRLCAIALEMEDEDYFVRLHAYDTQDVSWLRYMKYYDRSDPEDVGKTVWLNGHQDFVCLTMIFSQPMASLQVRDFHDNAEWKYVAYTPNAIVVNAGEILQWFTGGYFKAAIHRVIEPPKDQHGHDRCSVFYFAVPNKDVVINTVLSESPVLRRSDVKMSHEPENAPTSDEWCRGRVMISGKGDKFKGTNGNAAVEKVGKVTTTWFR